jgi:hypothetical protein
MAEPSPTASIHVASARSRDASPGPAAPPGRIEDRDELEVAGDRDRAPPPRRPPGSPSPSADAPATRGATRMTANRSDRRCPLLDPFAPPRLIRSPPLPQCAHRPDGLAHDASHDALLRSEARRRTPRTNRRPTAGAADLRHAVPGQRREDERPMRLAQRPDEPWRRPSVPARTTSTAAIARRRRDRATRARSPRRRTHRREHADGAAESRTCDRHIAHVVVRRPVLAVRGMTLAWRRR